MPGNWIEVDEARYDEMLGILPPAIMLGHGFLVGEPSDYVDGRARFAAFVCHQGRFFESTAPMTVRAFRDLDPWSVADGTA